jgi:hypothetical protein
MVGMLIGPLLLLTVSLVVLEKGSWLPLPQVPASVRVPSVVK